MEPDGAEGGAADLLASVEEEALRAWVAEFSGLRHGQRNPEALARKEALLIARLEGFGLPVERDPFRYGGRTHHNVVATLEGRGREGPPLLVGAHFDGSEGSPGADDNASGVAALLGAARALSLHPPARTVRFVGFNLEEPQGPGDRRCRHGSRHFVRRARFGGDRYEGVIILEMVAYADARPGSQRIPLKLPVPVPDAGTFLGAVGTRRARRLMARFREAAGRRVPDLEVISYQAPLRGWLMPIIRMSDHAAFWDWGYPALMLTDTAFLRNPNYHRPTDTPETLDYGFLTRVTRALVSALAAV
ncbi:MAG: M28 family peptidase [bacterium]